MDPLEPGTGFAPDGGAGGDDDEVSRRDLDVEAFPLPRVPRAVAYLFLLRVIMMAAGILAGLVAWLVGGPGLLLLVLLWPALWLLALILEPGTDGYEAGFLQLERGAHPRFFAIVDDVCARLALAPPGSIFLVNESNAYNATVGRDSSIVMGFPLVAAYDLVSLRHTLGHELGHHMAGDSADDARMAWSHLQDLSRLHFMIFPGSGLAGWLEKAAAADTLRRCRLSEYAADFWGGVAAGHGTMARSLLQDRWATYLWWSVLDDVAVLQEAGLRVDNVYRILEGACRTATIDGFTMLPCTRPTDPDSTHPAENARAVLVEKRLGELPTFVADGGDAMELFESHDAITHDLTELFYDRSGRGDGDWLDVIDDDALWPRYIEVVRPQLRGAWAVLGHPRLAEPMSSRALFEEVRMLVEAGVRFVVDQTDPTVSGMLHFRETLSQAKTRHVDVTQRMIHLLLDVLVADGVLEGTVGFGIVRAVAVGRVECFQLVLASRLAHGERWDDVAAEIEHRAQQRAALQGWATGGVAGWRGDAPTPTAPAWERDTEENVVPNGPADNSDRERTTPGEARPLEAPAAE